MNPTRLLKKTTALITLLITISSVCSAQNKDFMNVIPAKSPIVMAFDSKSLLSKSGITGNDSMLAELTSSQMYKQNPLAGQMIINVLTNPAEVGLDANEKIYIFMTDRNDSYARVMKIADVEKVKAFVKMGVVAQIFNSYTEHRDYTSVALDNGTILAFNDKTLICIDDYSDDNINIYQPITELLSNKIENSIVVNPGFQKIMGDMHDIGIYISDRAIASYYGAYLVLGSSANSEIDSNMDKLSVLYDMDFKNGELATKAELYSTDPAVMNTFLKPNLALQKIKSTFFSAFPSSTLGYLSFGLNGEELYKLMNNNSLVKELFGDQFEKIEKIRAIDGDITMAITGLTPNGDPIFLCYAQVKNNDLLEMLVNKKDGLIPRSELKLYAKNKYTAGVGRTQIYFGIEGGTMYATNDPEIVKRVAKSIDNPLSGNPKAAKVKDAYTYMMVNFEEIINTMVVQKLLSNESETDAEFVRSIGLFSHAEIVTTSQTQMEMNIYTKNKEENILKTIMEIAKKYFALGSREETLEIEPIIMEEPQDIQIVDVVRGV